MPLPTMNDVSPVNQLLSNLSVAYRQDMPAISDLVFPRVSVELPNGTFFTWDKADRWRRQMFKHVTQQDHLETLISERQLACIGNSDCDIRRKVMGHAGHRFSDINSGPRETGFVVCKILPQCARPAARVE